MLSSVIRRNVACSLRTGFSSSAALPTIHDKIVTATFVDCMGERFVLKGLEGMTLPEISAMNNCDVLQDDNQMGGGLPCQIKHTDDWTEDVFGEGLHSSQTHVILSQEWYDKLPPMMYDEDRLLEEMDYFERAERTPHSRIGAAIKVTRDLDGIVVHVPDPLPFDTS